MPEIEQQLSSWPPSPIVDNAATVTDALGGYRPLAPRVGIIAALVWGGVAIQAMAVGSTVLAFLSTGSAYLAVAVNVFYVVIFAITGILYLVWLRDAVANVYSLDPIGRIMSRVGAAVDYFLPIACLFRPYQTMRELWLRTCAEADLDDGHRLIKWWWALWIISNAISSVLGIVVSTDPTNAALAAGGGTIDFAISTVAALFFVKVVTEVSKRQDARYAMAKRD